MWLNLGTCLKIYHCATRGGRKVKRKDVREFERERERESVWNYSTHSFSQEEQIEGSEE